MSLLPLRWLQLVTHIPRFCLPSFPFSSSTSCALFFSLSICSQSALTFKFAFEHELQRILASDFSCVGTAEDRIFSSHDGDWFHVRIHMEFAADHTMILVSLSSPCVFPDPCQFSLRYLTCLNKPGSNADYMFLLVVMEMVANNYVNPPLLILICPSIISRTFILAIIDFPLRLADFLHVIIDIGTTFTTCPLKCR
jgi:hypothetical protein